MQPMRLIGNRPRLRVLACCLLVWITVHMPSAQAEASSICGQTIEAPGSTPVKATLTLEKGESTALAFESDRGERRLILDFDVTGCEFPVDAVQKPFVVNPETPVTAEGRVIPQGFSAVGKITAVDKAVVTYTLDPANPTPGSYVGAVVVTDPRVHLVRIPVTVTLQYDNPILLFISVILPAIFFGTLAVWGKARLAGSTVSYRRWWRRLGNLLGVAGALVAARLAFGKAFLSDATWGAKSHGAFWKWPITSDEWWSLAAIIVTAFLGALTAATLGGDAARRDNQGVPDET